MKRVAVAIENTGSNWLGGVNYFRNLFAAIDAHPAPRIEMVLVTGQHKDVTHFEGYVQIVRSSMFDRGSFLWFIRKTVQKIFKRDVLLYLFLRRHNVDFLSHSGCLWRGCLIPAMPWIPDFQVFHMPNMYDAQRIKNLENTYANFAKRGSCVLLSSYSAKNDFNEFIGSEFDSRVLQFASTLMRGIEWQVRDEIALRYQLERPWFHLPNQFWAHKNHMIVLEALNLAKKNGLNLLVVATGNTQDHRNPNYIINLKDKIKAYDLEECFLMTGIVPYEDMLSIMKHSIAVINPSKFEGWSTTVEEARSLGKQIVLSSIGVHKEQHPPRAHFFESDDANTLSTMIIQLEAEFNILAEEQAYFSAIDDLSDRQKKFAEMYQNLVLDVIEKYSQLM